MHWNWPGAPHVGQPSTVGARVRTTWSFRSLATGEVLGHKTQVFRQVRQQVHPQIGKIVRRRSAFCHAIRLNEEGLSPRPVMPSLQLWLRGQDFVIGIVIE
jgi:hypothetical protein